MIQQVSITLRPYSRGNHLITSEIVRAITSPIPQSGLINLFVQHTSCALTVNENADPDVRKDLAASLNHIAPENAAWYDHTLEGPDDMPAHVKCSLLGASLTIPIVNGRLALGTWQGIYLCEFRNHASSRRIVATILS